MFGGWDIFEDNSHEAAKTAGVLEDNLLEKIRPELEASPMSAVFDRRYVKRLDGPNVKKEEQEGAGGTAPRGHAALQDENRCDRLVMVWCGSTEVFLTESPAHATLDAFEKALEANDDNIPSSMVYAYAAIKEGIPYANAAPNLSADIPALIDLAATTGSAAGGQGSQDRPDLIKTIIAPGLPARRCWESRGGARPTSSATATARCWTIRNRSRPRRKARSQSSTTSSSRISTRSCHKDLCHVVRINYYPPRGDNKEGWDNIDISAG